MEDFIKLRRLTEEKLQGVVLTAQEKQRLEEELSVIKQTGTAEIFLQYTDTMSA